MTRAVHVATLFCLMIGTAGAQSGSQRPCKPSWDEGFGVPGMNQWVYTLASVGEPGKEYLYAGGYFTEAGGNPASGVARWNGYHWENLGAGVEGLVMAVAGFDDGSGFKVYIGGLFSKSGNATIHNIARWNAKSGVWEAVGGGVDDAIIAMAVYDDGSGPALYAGGSFLTAGGVSANRIARWDGKQWSALGEGANEAVRAMVVMDDGEGPALYVGGNFHLMGGQSANRMARWDGKQWTALGSGLIGPGVRGMAAFDDGSGMTLYVGGVFMTAGGKRAGGLAKWNPREKQWTSLGTGVNERVVAMAAFDAGDGPYLYAAGWFTTADDKPANRLIRWDGKTWQQVDRGANMVCRALAVHHDGLTRGKALYVGGGFQQMNGRTANHIARLIGCCE